MLRSFRLLIPTSSLPRSKFWHAVDRLLVVSHRPGNGRARAILSGLESVPVILVESHRRYQRSPVVTAVGLLVAPQVASFGNHGWDSDAKGNQLTSNF